MAESRRRFRYLSRWVTLCSTLALAACAVPSPTVTPAAAPTPPADPVLRAVATGGIGGAQPTAAGTVTVTSDYTSAAGHECRAYTVNGGPPALACTDGASWRNIPPLTETTP